MTGKLGVPIMDYMRIGLLSDTHVPQAEEALPQEVREAFQGVSLILHGGDIYIPSVLDDLAGIAPVLAARGDDDWGEILADQRVKEKHVLNINGKVVWLVHMRPYYLLAPPRPSKDSTEPVKDERPDIVVFGHEHSTVVQHLNGILFINPGSPTFLNYLRGLGTVGILDIDSDKVDVNILRL